MRRTRGATNDWARLLASVDRGVSWSSHVTRFDASVPEVSAWSVGQHLEHLLLSDRCILAWLERVADDDGSEPGGRSDVRGGAARRGGPTPVGWLVLTTRFIPRGRGKAPGFTLPDGLRREQVEEAFRDIRESSGGARAPPGDARRLAVHPAAPRAGDLHGASLAAVRPGPPRAPREDHPPDPAGGRTLLSGGMVLPRPTCSAGLTGRSDDVLFQVTMSDRYAPASRHGHHVHHHGKLPWLRRGAPPG